MIKKKIILTKELAKAMDRKYLKVFKDGRIIDKKLVDKLYELLCKIRNQALMSGERNIKYHTNKELKEKAKLFMSDLLD